MRFLTVKIPHFTVFTVCLLVFCCLSNKIGTGTQPEYSLWYCNMAVNSTSNLF